MTRFVNLMASDIWSEADITNRTEALIASEFSPTAVAILTRKATGAALGQYQLSAEDAAEIARYAEVSERARQLGKQAMEDMALLREVLDVEKAMRRLGQPLAGAEAADQAAIDADLAERSAAQAVVDAASPAALAMIQLRNPAPAVADVLEAAK